MLVFDDRVLNTNGAKGRPNRWSRVGNESLLNAIWIHG